MLSHYIIQNYTNNTSSTFINGPLYCNLFLHESVDTCGYLQVILEEHIIGGSWRGHTSVWVLGFLSGSTIPNIYIHVALNVAMFHLMIPNAVCLNNPPNPYMEHSLNIRSPFDLQVTKERVHRAINVAVATVTLLVLGTVPVAGQPGRKPLELPLQKRRPAWEPSL